MTAELVAGDPAACSGAGGALLTAAATLRADADRVLRARDDLRDGWPGRASVAARRRCDVLGEGLDAAARAFELLGRSLQDHAAELAEAVGVLREVTGRARAAGLVVHDGRVRAAWGVTGEASPSQEVRRDEAAARLQADLDVALLQLERRRRRLAATAEAGRRDLSSVSEALRR